MLHARNPENRLVPIINSTKYSHKESMLDSDMLVIQHDSLLVQYGKTRKETRTSITRDLTVPEE